MLGVGYITLIYSYIHSISRWLGNKKTAILTVCALSLFNASVVFASPEAAPSRSGGLLNILLLGCIAYFLVRSFRRRSGGNDKTKPGQWHRREDAADPSSEKSAAGKPLDRHEAARQAWSVLRSEEKTSQPDEQPSIVREAGFDEAEFLEGAKLFFTRVQQADTEQELADLKEFLSADVYSDMLMAVRRNPEQARIEVMLVTARLMEMKSKGERTFATVFFDAQLRKGAAGEQTVQTRTAWEFSRDDSMANALWVLEKINKVDH